MKRKRKVDGRRVVLAVTYHRNGICGAPWCGVTFIDPASALEAGLEPDAVFLAVVPLDAVERGLEMARNPNGLDVYVVALDAPEERWRGDHYAEFALAAIRERGDR